ncbi:class I SAM-dependent methyltransferase [Thermodesulfobacteriota bacterium]
MNNLEEKNEKMIRNPHFDDDRVVWKDEYSCVYDSVLDSYSEQFDHQWELLLNGNPEFAVHASNIDDKRISDRVYGITGKHPDGKPWYPDEMDPEFDSFIPEDAYRNKECADFGCGPGRWTKTMMKMGAKSVLSVDASEHAIKSVSRFNPNVLRSNIFDIPEKHPKLKSSFDAAICWGVIMCTHDPKRAFDIVASTIRPEGSLYIMVYAPSGLHGQQWLVDMRKRFHRELKGYEERMRFCEKLADRRWNNDLSLKRNILFKIEELLGRPKPKVIGYWDAMMPFYNWVIDRETIKAWYSRNGFASCIFLNDTGKNWTGLKKWVAYHVYGVKS